MILILLAVSLAIVICAIALHFAIYAFPFMVGLSAFQYVYASDAGFLMYGLAAIAAALVSVGLVIAVLGFAKNPASRLIALNLLGGAGGLFIGVAAMLNLNAIGTGVLSR